MRQQVLKAFLAGCMLAIKGSSCCKTPTVQVLYVEQGSQTAFMLDVSQILESSYNSICVKR